MSNQSFNLTLAYNELLLLSVDILGREASSEAPLEGVVEEEEENFVLDSVRSQSEEER